MATILITMMYAWKLLAASRNVSCLEALNEEQMKRLIFASYYIIAPVPIVLLCQLSQLRIKARPFSIRSQKKTFLHFIAYLKFHSLSGKDGLTQACMWKTHVCPGRMDKGQKQNFNPLSKNKHCLRSLLSCCAEQNNRH